MFNHPLLLVLFAALLSPVISYLINQLPPIKQFPGSKALIFWLTFEIVILGSFISWWNTTEEKDRDLEILLATVGSIALLCIT